MNLPATAPIENIVGVLSLLVHDHFLRHWTSENPLTHSLAHFLWSPLSLPPARSKRSTREEQSRMAYPGYPPQGGAGYPPAGGPVSNELSNKNFCQWCKAYLICESLCCSVALNSCISFIKYVYDKLLKSDALWFRFCCFLIFLGGGRLSRGLMLGVNLAYKFPRVHCR